MSHYMQQHFQLIVNDSNTINPKYKVIQLIKLLMKKDIMIISLFNQSKQNILNAINMQIEVLITTNTLQHTMHLCQLYRSLLSSKMTFNISQCPKSDFITGIKVHFIHRLFISRQSRLLVHFIHSRIMRHFLTCR